MVEKNSLLVNGGVMNQLEPDAWQQFWVEHSQCGGEWLYIKDQMGPRVVCTCVGDRECRIRRLSCRVFHNRSSESVL